MSGIIIRNVELKDLRFVSEITIRGWKTAYRGIVDDDYLESLSIEENYQKRIKDYKEDGFIVAEQNGEVVGFCRYRIGNNYKDEYPDVDCELCALYVKPEVKRKGIGRALVEYVKNEFRSNNRNKMIVWCLKENYPSRAFYEKVGGKLCGETTCIRGREYEEVGFIYNLNEKFKYEIPTLKRKEDAINYIKEHIDTGSDINGSGGLDRYINDYEGWLEKLEQDYNRIPNEEKVPARTFFLVRVSDDKIIGMVNIRTALNKRLEEYGGNIGYGIRPSERGKGYNKINLYLALKICNEYGIKIAKLDADLDNTASWKTMEALGGKRTRIYFCEQDNCEVVDYEINVQEALENYKKIYEEKVKERYICPNLYK